MIVTGFGHDGETLLIVGASTRAAAFSARNAGMRVVCGDLYGDADLRQMCPVTVVNDLPDGLEDVARAAPLGPWMYTGALENHPRLVERIAAVRPLAGNSADVLRRVRDPFLLAATLAAAGLPAPECVASGDDLPGDGSWLRKRKRSAGGLHVQAWNREEKDRLAGSRNDASSWYFQRRIEGVCCSAAYVAAQRRALLLGVTKQLVCPQFGQKIEHVPSAFCYAGSMGPLDINEREWIDLQRIGNLLADKFDLSGLFGVDLICREGSYYPIEVNPRYTASMEVLEWALGRSMVGWHWDACLNGRLPSESETKISSQQRAKQPWRGKAIVYAATDVEVTAEATSRLMAVNEERACPFVADIPMPGILLRAGQPAATVFAENSPRGDVVEELSEKVRWCREVLGC